MQFLIKNNKTDPQVLKIIKDSVRSSVPHNAACLANGIMQCGTTCDDFLRCLISCQFVCRNSSLFTVTTLSGCPRRPIGTSSMLSPRWATFTKATRTRRCECYSSTYRKLMAAGFVENLVIGKVIILLQDSAGYKEGGALYALGLIHANHGTSTVINYLVEQLGAAQTPPSKHGACLGLGLAAMGTHDRRECNSLKFFSSVLSLQVSISSYATFFTQTMRSLQWPPRMQWVLCTVARTRTLPLRSHMLK